jgi:hypothetical protein
MAEKSPVLEDPIKSPIWHGWTMRSQASTTEAAPHINQEATMEIFEHRKNMSRFRDLLLLVTDTDQRQQIQQLLAEEEVKALPPRLGPPLE